VTNGLRVHLSGSAAHDCVGDLLRAAHSYVRALTEELIARGGGLVLGVGGEPVGAAGEPCLFDWTALDAVAAVPEPASQWPRLRPERFVVVVSQRGLEKIPAERANVWERCLARSDFALEVAPPGWRMAGIIRERQVLRGDVLLALGGGAGVEHLAEMYRDEGKPVVPVYAELGAFNNDGNGGSRFLHGRALADIDTFIRLRDGAGNAAARLTQLRLAADGGTTELARRTADILDDLRPRPAFYVRLLATDHADYDAVERFFRDVVDPVVADRGFTPYEMGRGRPETVGATITGGLGREEAGCSGAASARGSLVGPHLAVLPRAAIVVEDRYASVFKLDRIRPAIVADTLAELQIAWPAIPIVFTDTRPLAEEWTYRWLAAAARHSLDDTDTTARLADLPTPTTAPAAPPSTAQVRAWARTVGLDVPPRGRLSPDIWAAYRAQHPQGT